ncbi:MAG TPA: MMPL family transporter [Candidatus Polarisedimenticolia bacterium]|nr:MMPL family transporter [Candidatus Polarisedimenticolia bacterium]
MPIGSQQRRQGLFLAIEEFSRRHPGAVFLATFLIVCVAALLGSRMTLDTDILDLVPRGDRAVDAFKTALLEFGGADYLAVMVEAPEGHPAEEYADFVDLFAQKAEGLPGVRQVECRIGGNGELFELLRQFAVLFIPPEDLPKLRAKLSDEGIRQQVMDDRRILESPSSAFLKDVVRNDPFGIAPLLWGRLVKGQAALRIRPGADGYFVSEDDTTLLVLIKPERAAQDLGFTKRLLSGLRQAEAEARAELAGEDGPAGIEDLEVEYAGSYVVALYDSELIKSDMRLTAVLSFGGVLALYLIGYRRMGALLYSSVPLLVGQILTFGVAFMVFGHLNSASSGFVAMVMGLGTDFTIVMYARYVEERRQGLSLAESSRLMMGEGALGMFTGAITSAGTFYSMCVTEFRGLWELGFLIGTGILLSMVAILFLLPAMIQWNEGRPGREDKIRKLHIQSFGFEGLIPLAARRPVPALAVLAAVTAILGVAAWNVGFSDNIRDLRSPYNKGVLAQEKLGRVFGGDLNFMIAIAEARTVDGVLEKVRRVQAEAERFLQQGTLRSADSILTYLPAPSRQMEVIQALQEGKDGDFDPRRIEATFRRALEDHGFQEDAFDAYLADFKLVLGRREPLRLEDIQAGPLGAMLDRYIRKDERDGADVYRAAVYLFPGDRRWRREAPPGLVEALQGGDPDVTVTGVNVVSKRLREIFARDAKIAISVGLVLVSLLLWLDFRSLRLMLVANLQVLTGVVWMLGVMSLTGLEMNFINCFVATMILGVGVDYGIHLIHRMRLNGGVVDSGVMQTGKAVAMAAMTNVVGFGSLALSNYPGLRSVGIISVVGSVACLLTALTLLPALMSFRVFSKVVEEHAGASSK